MIFMSSAFCSMAIADSTITTLVKWDTSAVKSTKSALIANASPRILNFSYSPNSNAFNVIHSDYDLAVLIPDGITDTVFKTKIIRNSLTRKSDDSSLDVGVHWNGKKLSKTTELILEKTTKQPLALFSFNIESANADNKTILFQKLNNGLWSGDVSLGFTAYWVN